MAYSAFENDYKVAIINILKDIYSGTDYWGTSASGNKGIVKPLTENDNPTWSNYNFINTHWTVRDTIIIPFLGKPKIEVGKKYTESEDNAKFFKLLWKKRNEIFGPDSPLKDRIVNAINRTRKSGDKRESLVKLTLESIQGVTIEMTSEAGGTQDFLGVDLKIDSKNDILPSGSGQVKPFTNITKDKENWFVNTDLRRKYNTDYMIFGKQSGMEYHVAVFINKPDEWKFLPTGQISIPKGLIKLLINYNLISKKSKIKSF